MFDSEKKTNQYAIPDGKYSEGVNHETTTENKVENVVSMYDNPVYQARQLVAESFIPYPEYEQINESLIDAIRTRGQEIDEARRRHMEHDPYGHKLNHKKPKVWLFRAVEKVLYEPDFDDLEKDLIEDESHIGATIFNIEDFYFYKAKGGHWFTRHIRQTQSGPEENIYHYEELPMAILKSSSDALVPNEFISGEELKNFDDATRVYHELVLKDYERRLESSSKKAA